MGGHELAVGPQVALVDEHVAAALEDQSGRPRLGDPGTVELAFTEQRQRLGVLDVDDLDVAPAGRVGGEAILGQPGAQGDVLGVAEGWRGERRVGVEVLGGVDAFGDDEARPARGGSGDDPQRLAVGLGEAIDRRVGTDERCVDRSGQQRLDRLAAGVEVQHLQGDVGTHGLGERTAVDADDRRGMGDVREVPEPQRHRFGFGRASGRGACRHSCGEGESGCGGEE